MRDKKKQDETKRSGFGIFPCFWQDLSKNSWNEEITTGAYPFHSSNAPHFVQIYGVLFKSVSIAEISAMQGLVSRSKVYSLSPPPWWRTRMLNQTAAPSSPSSPSPSSSAGISKMTFLSRNRRCNRSSYITGGGEN